MKKYDVASLGELLIDFTENGISSQNNPLFEANPGGAPCNVLAMLSKLGKTTAFVGKVGDDFFGRQLSSAIESCGIDSTGLSFDKEIHTTLAFVKKLPNGDRDFSFYRNPGADMNLSKEDVEKVSDKIISNCKIFHYGSLSMTSEKCFEATMFAIETAKKSGALISFDPNLRPPLWKTLDEAKEKISYGMKMCDIMKISDNEILWFTGEKDYDTAVEKLRAEYPNIKLLLLSLGKDGSLAYFKDIKVSVPTFLEIKPVETTGAGDTFCACVLNYVLEHGLENLTDSNLSEMLSFANAAATLVTTKKGALMVMPEKCDVMKLVESRK
ncbi:MAG: carbohydrate kinase [Treponema sp.]